MDALREDILFRSEGITYRAWLYRPAAAPAGMPLIVMAHGLGGLRSAGLAPYAERFAAAGLAVLLFDYRHFGASDGTPRQLVSIRRQLQDWAAAITCARRLPGIDPARIALWGSSFSGGHVVVAAARNGRVSAISAQGPMMDGLAATLNIGRYAGVGMLLRLVARGLRDMVAALLGRPPVMLPQLAPPGQTATMSTPDADPGYRAIVGPDWRNEICARFALTLALYRPLAHARRVHCPALIAAAREDSVAPAAAAVETARRIGEHAELRLYDCGHFDLYVGAHFERACTDQVGFFRRVLRPAPQHAAAARGADAAEGRPPTIQGFPAAP
jgi:dienelactone hydrolase